MRFSIFLGSVNPDTNKMYIKACKFVELSSKYIYFGYMKIVFPCATFPYLFMSYFKYYTTDLGKDAFTLPFPVWYVC